MSLERLALGTLLPGFRGTTPPDWVRRAVEDGLGGVVLFADNVPFAGGLGDVVVAIDEEGGDVTRLEAHTGSSYPGNLALGTIDDVELTEQIAASIARDVSAGGATMNLAPVADVNVNSDNAAIGVRSFGADAELVARHTSGFVRGTQREGSAACAKHFPGHGHTTEDSHKELPTLDLDRDALRAGPLRPFAAAIEAGVAAIMTAHIRVPALDDLPATLSRRILSELLRGELGFDGVIVTDALEMGAIANSIGLETAAVGALAAGADALCLGYHPGEREVRSIAEAIVTAVQTGELAEERLVEANARVRSITPRLRGSEPRTPDLIGLEAARRSLLIDGDASVSGQVTVIELRPEPLVAVGAQPHGLADALRLRNIDVQDVRVHEGEAHGAPSGGSLVLVLRDAHRHMWQQALADEVVARRPDAVVVETGLPAWRPPRSRAYLATYGSGRVNLEAAAQAIAAKERSEAWQPLHSTA